MKIWLARRMRRWADRLDRRGAPKATHLSFTFERGVGLVVHDGALTRRRGCPLWYLGDDDYDRAHAEATTIGVT